MKNEKIRVVDLVEWLATIPYLLGFHPAESLVLLAEERDAKPILARCDLPATEVDFDRLIARLLRSESVGSPSGAKNRFGRGLRLLAVGFSGADETVWTALAEVARGTPEIVDLTLAQISGSRYRSAPTGEWRSFEPAGTVAAATATYLGLVAWGSRAELARYVAGPGPVAESEMTKALIAAAGYLAARQNQLPGLAEQLIRDFGRTGAGPALAETALLIGLANQPKSRDVMWSALRQHNARELFPFWQHLVAHSPGEFAFWPLLLFGVCAWLLGEGALFNVCVARAERIDPGRLAGSFIQIIQERLLPPTIWDRALAETLAPGCLSSCCAVEPRLAAVG